MKKRRIVALLMATAMSVGLFTGCGKEPVAQESVPTETNASEASSEVEETKGYDGVENLVISEEGATVTMHYTFMANGAPTGDMPIWQEIAKITGVQMENTASPSIADEAQSINTMLASGELPDIIVATEAQMASVVAQGALLPLDELIDESTPNIKKFLEDYPEAITSGVGADGKMYLLSGTLGGEAGEQLPSLGWYIRYDWLEKLGKKVPTTLEEFKEVLYAFRNEDPNGNGIKDEIPYFYRSKAISGLLQLFDVNEKYYVDDNGVIQYGKAQESYKTCIKELAQWYADGVIDAEIYTRGSQARQELLGNNLGGCTFDWFTSTGSMNDTVREMVPDINFDAMAPVTNINGEIDVKHSRKALHGYKVGISATCENPDMVIKYLDFCLSEQGSLLLSSGIEGVDYTIEDGVFTPTEHALTAHSGGYPNYIRSIGGFEFANYGNIEGEKSSMNETARAGFELYEQNSQWFSPQFPTLSYTEEEQAAFDAHNANVNTCVSEYEQGVILGTIDVDSTWESHVAELESLGLKEILAAYNSAYARYLETLK